MVARALVGTGLHPAIGLYHKNQYNGLCLADDIMEPFRPWVDWRVYSLLKSGVEPKIDQPVKQVLLGLLAEEVLLEERQMPLMVAAHTVVSRLKKAMSDRRQQLVFPQRLIF
jgi:CRISPR-associated protein Cas1